MLIFVPSNRARHRSPVRLILPLLLIASLLAACGYKGPLYLPKPKPESPPAATKPAPEPRKDGETTQ